jgi:hypothetical protein
MVLKMAATAVHCACFPWRRFTLFPVTSNLTHAADRWAQGLLVIGNAGCAGVMAPSTTHDAFPNIA